MIGIYGRNTLEFPYTILKPNNSFFTMNANNVDTMIAELENSVNNGSSNNNNNTLINIDPNSLTTVQNLLEQLIEILRQCIITVEEFQPDSQSVLNSRMQV